jgi:tetratricopeptide (TPR) repeat protein
VLGAIGRKIPVIYLPAKTPFMEASMSSLSSFGNRGDTAVTPGAALRISVLAGLVVLCSMAKEPLAQTQNGTAAREIALAAQPLVASPLPVAQPGDRTTSTGTDNPSIHYSLPFGGNAFLPSQAETDFSGFISPSSFPSAEYCGHCHQAVHQQWRESVHANSFRAPFYKRNVDQLIHDKGIEFSRHCEGCHNPIALFSGALTPKSPVSRGFDEDGVTCSVCHSIVRLKSETGLASYVMGQPAVMVDDSGKPVPGMPSDAAILARLDLHRKAVMHDFYRTSEFCGSCHKANLPPELNGYKWLRAFSTYDEWQQSSWSRETPLPFYRKTAVSTCQTCHMERVAAIDPAAHNGQVASHRWPGANTAIPAYYGYADQTHEVQKFLKDKLRIDIFGLSQDATGNPAATAKPITYAPIGEAAVPLASGKSAIISLVITNNGIGHSLVPEQRDFYESWVEFTASDQSGRVLYHSGYLKPDGQLDPEAHSYTNRIIARDGSLLDRHQVWSALTRAYDNTIQSGRSDLVRYRFRIPAGVSELTLTAKVNYRRFRRSYTDFVFDGSTYDPAAYPVSVIATASRTVPIGAASAPPTQPASNKDIALRWNNYGIGLLDQQQFPAAATAFEHVAQLNPAIADGWLNAGVARYMNGEYDAALLALHRAQQVEPNSPRAAYYEGLCYRWQYRYDRAVEKLAPIAAAYPRFRQVHDDLGYIYMVQHKYEKARVEYLQVQKVDPDDLLAHRWIAAAYRHLGMTDKALIEESLTSLYKEDPVAGWQAQHFWQQNPKVARELVPYHVHSDDPSDVEKQAQRMNDLQNPPSRMWFLQ